MGVTGKSLSMLLRRRLRRRWLRWGLGGLVLAAVALGSMPLYRIGLAGAGFKAQMICSGVFVSGRQAAAVVEQDLGGERYRLLRFFDWQLDRQAQRVTASFFGIAEQRAIHREGLGCTLVRGMSEEALREQAAGLFEPPPAPDPNALWPEGERVEAAIAPTGDVDADRLAAAVQAAFAEPATQQYARNTRALVVVHRGRIVVERYAPGFGPHMPLLGWSMSKTAINALTGILVGQGKLHLSQADLLAQWRNDARRSITLEQLLHMQSGLAFDESYGSALSDVVQMLFVEGDKAAFAASKPLAHTPGTHWAYSSGTTVIIAAVLRSTFPGVRDYLRFAREALFVPLGMRTAVFEADAAGTLVGSSLLYASARDWARLGLLYLNDGVWNGRRILPEGWVDLTLRPAPAAPNGRYGAHVWLDLPGPGERATHLPDDAFFLLGHDQQVVAVIPSRELVIVRLGLTPDRRGWDHDAMLAPIVAAFPARGG